MRVDREPRLLEVAIVLRLSVRPEAAVADRGDRDERLDEHVLDAELPQLLGELPRERAPRR